MIDDSCITVQELRKAIDDIFWDDQGSNAKLTQDIIDHIIKQRKEQP